MARRRRLATMLLALLAASVPGCGRGGRAGGEPSQELGSVRPVARAEAAALRGTGVRTGELCPALPPPRGRVVRVGPAEAGSLDRLVAAARPGDTVLFEDGTYRLGGTSIHVEAEGLTLRSASGVRDRVVLDGEWESAEPISIHASGVTVADLTVRRALNHPIHVAPPPDRSIRDVVIYNVAVLDPGQQGIKVNQNGAGYADDGVVACSHIELTDEGRPRVLEINRSCYTGGIDAHQARGWVVRDNRIVGFFCPEGLSEHGVHFWTGSRDTVVERNVIVDCARGIGFGMREGGGRRYQDTACPGGAEADHYGGIVRNNVVWASRPELFASEAGFDGGISLWAACGAVVVHNTVCSTAPPFASIEWRFRASRVELANNLLCHRAMERDGATGSRRGDLEGVAPGIFVDPARGDLHLAAGATVAIDRGVLLPDGICADDLDGELRDRAPDLGADEIGTRR